jgi:hypothetical protein
MTSQNGFLSEFSVFRTNDVKQVPGGDVNRRPKLMLLFISLVGPGVNHHDRFRNFVLGVELCPPNCGKLAENSTIFWDEPQVTEKDNSIQS